MLKKCSQGSIKKYRNTVENLEGREGGVVVKGFY
jgi:hypothetical protein